MKKGIKIILLILLLGCSGFEIWYLFFNKKDNKKETLSNPLEQEVVINNDDLKYVADLEGKYKNNDLTYKEIKEGIYYYLQIDGLKNEELQTKINNTIKERTKAITLDDIPINLNIVNQLDTYKYIGSTLTSSFSNTISIEIGFSYLVINYDSKLYDVMDTINIDLNTGEELSINDILLTKEVLKQKLFDNAYQKIYKKIGIICYGGPCNNPEPHYERVEDGVISISNQFQKGDFKFSFDQQNINLYFYNSFINQPIMDFAYPKPANLPEEKYGKPIKMPDSDELIYNDYYTKYYNDTLSFGNYYDSVIIFNKFTKEESLFKTNEEPELYTFTKTKEEDSLLYEEGNNLYYFVEEKLYNSDPKMTDTEKLVINESKGLEDKNTKNIWIYKKKHDFYANKYIYNYYVLNHYSIPNDKYNELRKKVFESRTKNLSNYKELDNLYKLLEEYKPKDSYYFYIMDSNGKEHNSNEILNYNYDWNKIIPEKWLTGKYKTIKELLDNTFIIYDKNYSFKDRMVIYIEYDCNETICMPIITISYGNEKIELDEEKYSDLNIFEMFIYE